MILRRLYLYLVSAAGLGLLAAGLALLETTVLMFIFNAPNSSDPIYRTQLAGFTAMTLVDVHQALANLPPQASYRLTPAEQGGANDG